MANSFAKMGRGAIGNTIGSLYMVGGGKTAILKSFSICNTTTGALTVQLYIVPSGDSAAAANALLYDLSIPAKETYVHLCDLVIAAGDTIQAVGSATGLTFLGSGVESA
jgi:hypothetical protein